MSKYVQHFFKLPEEVKEEILGLEPNFGYGAFSEITFYRTYARTLNDGTMESWNQVVIRVVEGIFSIRKDHYLKNHLHWDEDFWNSYSRNFAISMFNMEWLPAGRGLWAMGTEFLYNRGSMCLNNCGLTTIGDRIGEDIHWLMDCLMCGVGVGFLPQRNDDLPSYKPIGELSWTIPDTREGWCDSVKMLIDAHLTPNKPLPVFDYSEVRPAGLRIKGFGGISSGPDVLKELHKQILDFFTMYRETLDYDTVLLKTDIANAVGCCVVAGNVRRSAEIACGELYDKTFINLKNYKKYPYRATIGGMSNNSVFLEDSNDYDQLQNIVRRIIENGEPGIINLQNLKYGRIGKFKDNVKEDKAIGFNPCGEQPLEDKELCNLVESFPTRCPTVDRWYKALEYATVYASTCSLVATHRPETNAVMMRNRRIGVSIADFTGWVHNIGRNQVIKHLKRGYHIVRKINAWVNAEAGVPDSVRVTTIKPGGTIPKLVGVTSGCGYPTFRHTLRRIRVAENSPIVPILKKANIPYEQDVVSKNTLVFEFPLIQGPAKTGAEASVWEQAQNLVVLQREWSDNAVSNTLYFKPKWVKERSYQVSKLRGQQIYEINKKYGINLNELITYHESYETPNNRYVYSKETDEFTVYRYNPNHEENDLLSVLASIAPHIKSASLLPHTEDGVYPQMPESGISEDEYERRIEAIGQIDWSELRFLESEPERYCTGDKCERPQ